MNSIMEIANMLTNVVSQKASLLSSIPFLIAMPIRPRVFKRVAAVPIRLDPKQTELKFKDQNLVLSIAGLMSCLLLSGCTGSTYSSHFDCPMGEGAGCASISRVNKLIDRQEIDLGNDDAPSAKGAVANQNSSNQVYVYYGPDQLSRLIAADESKPPIAPEGN